jgi:hypothetical protein
VLAGQADGTSAAEVIASILGLYFTNGKALLYVQQVIPFQVARTLDPVA